MCGQMAGIATVQVRVPGQVAGTGQVAGIGSGRGHWVRSRALGQVAGIGSGGGHWGPGPCNAPLRLAI
jgi:hypothetical protein